MTLNDIKVLFFSKNAALSESIATILDEELNFNYLILSRLNELYNRKPDEINMVVILDLSCVFKDFEAMLKKDEAHLLSLRYIFLVDNQKIAKQICKRNFMFYEVIVKPFRIEELLHKIRLIAINPKQFDGSIFLNGNYFYPRKNEIKNGRGDSVRLTEKETEIITFLHRKKGKILPKEFLLKSIWGYNETISTHTLETHIYRLRKKIEGGLGEKELILKNNNGYYLNIMQSR